MVGLKEYINAIKVYYLTRIPRSGYSIEFPLRDQKKIIPPVITDPSDLLKAVNAAVPRSLPDDMRAEIGQEILLAVLAGDITLDEITAAAPRYQAKINGLITSNYNESLDRPVGSHDERTLGDVLGDGGDWERLQFENMDCNQ